MNLVQYLNKGINISSRRRWWDILFGFVFSILLAMFTASTGIKFFGGVIFYLLAMTAFVVGKREYIAIGMLLSLFLALILSGLFLIFILSSGYHG